MSKWSEVQSISRRTNAQGEGNYFPSSTSMNNYSFGHARDLKLSILFIANLCLLNLSCLSIKKIEKIYNKCFGFLAGIMENYSAYVDINLMKSVWLCLKFYSNILFVTKYIELSGAKESSPTPSNPFSPKSPS